MSNERWARIQQLEKEVRELRAQEEDERRALIAGLVEVLFKDLHYADVAIVKELVEEHGHRLYALEEPDDE